jgi:hypothetical protein
MDKLPDIEPITPSPENLTAILTCLGAKTTPEDREKILELQNPFAQKRGGMGFGGYAVIELPNGGSSFVNINLYSVKQADQSPLALRLKKSGNGEFELVDDEGKLFTQGKILMVPSWGGKRLRSGRAAIEIIQQHGPRNLVGVLDEPRCDLFDTGEACTFCSLNGGTTNAPRTVTEILEACELAREDRAAYNLTLTTGLQSSTRRASQIIEQVKELKCGLGSSALAIEIAPFPENPEKILAALRETGLDTIMIPLDCASREAQERFLPGKARLLQEAYWKNVEIAVSMFGAGNVTSNILVGLEPLEATLEAIEKMIEKGVIPEPLPVRWNEPKFTNPDWLIAARRRIAELVATRPIRNILQKTRAGCAACGGCAGIVVNNIAKANPKALKVLS